MGTRDGYALVANGCVTVAYLMLQATTRLSSSTSHHARLLARFVSMTNFIVAPWRPEGIRVAVSGDWFTSEGAARAATRRVQQQACTAMGP